MELTLVGVTLGSLLLATSLAAVAWKLLRDHRRFAAARAAALAALADGLEPAWPEIEEPSGSAVDAGQSADVETRPLVTAPLLTAVSRPRRRLPLALAASAVAAIGVASAGVYGLHRSGTHLWSIVASAAGAADTGPVTQPLELQSLHYAIDDASDFVVSGLIVDPAGGGAFDNVVAVVYLFNADGVCFAADRAPIKLDRLRPGDASTFEVRVHATMPVTRYRVGFRLPDGHAVGHLDKRPDAGHGAESSSRSRRPETSVGPPL